MVFCEINPKILLWVNIILNTLVFYVNELVFIVIRLVNIIYGLVYIVMDSCLGGDFNV
jgi:hypothetical protein